jgi:hypothetical protein
MKAKITHTEMTGMIKTMKKRAMSELVIMAQLND